MPEEGEPIPPDRPGGGTGIEAAARTAAELAGRAHPDDSPAAREARYAEVIGPDRTDHFLARFRRFDARGGAWAFTWNWPCAFFAPLWFAYRRMYAWAAVLILVELFLMVAGPVDPDLSLLVSVLFGIAVPACADWLYYRHAGGIVSRSLGAAATDAARGAWRRAHGGVSWTGPAVVVVVNVAASLWAVATYFAPGG
jgi:Protein of unknown function (DUF2628)